MDMKVEDKDLPGLYQSADSSSIKEQNKYFNGIAWYLILLIVAALFAFFSDGEPNPIFKIIATILFFATMFIMIWLRRTMRWFPLKKRRRKCGRSMQIDQICGRVLCWCGREKAGLFSTHALSLPNSNTPSCLSKK